MNIMFIFELFAMFPYIVFFEEVIKNIPLISSVVLLSLTLFSAYKMKKNKQLKLLKIFTGVSLLFILFWILIIWIFSIKLYLIPIVYLCYFINISTVSLILYFLFKKQYEVSIYIFLCGLVMSLVPYIGILAGMSI